MKIRRFLRVLRNELWLYLRLFKDKRTPKISKIMLILALIYLLSPIDIIPDLIPFAGFIDEIIIIPLVFYLATMFIPKDVVEENRREVQKNNSKKQTKKKFENAQEGEIVE